MRQLDKGQKGRKKIKRQPSKGKPEKEKKGRERWR